MANWFVAMPIDASGWFRRVTTPPPGVRLFAPEDLHLTLAFLGAVAEAAARSAFAAAHALPLTRSEVALGPVVPMGSRQRFTALSARLSHGEGPLAAAMTAVRDQVCDAAGARRETRPALPHLTLARPARRATREQRAHALAWAEGLDLGAPRVRVEAVALYTWAANRRERLFTIVDRFALASPSSA